MSSYPDLPGFAEHFGVPVTIVGDDADFVVALGHHEPRRFIAALCRMVRRDLGWRSLSCEWGRPSYGDLADDVEQLWAIRAKSCGDHGGDSPDPDCANCNGIRREEWWLRWGDAVAESSPGAFPVTVMEGR